MAHWAEIDENGVVLRVTVGNNEEPDEGYQWLIDNLGGTWLQTSYNGSIRKQFAATGYVYDSENDVFIAPSPFPSWVLDENFDWQAPVPYPSEGEWMWDEEAGDWVAVPEAPEV
jgi:hypothetical protein